MVKVYRCHHFESQNVFSTSAEPLAICTSIDSVFVATDNFAIEEFIQVDSESESINKFSTVGIVREMKCHSSGDFVVTVEENPSNSNGKTKFFVRVYTNLREAMKRGPIKLTIAGQMTRKRSGQPQNKQQVTAIEIPLKMDPDCIAVDVENRNFAVAIRKQLFVYTLFSKQVADTKTMYSDIKRILDLEFRFNIKLVDMCDEFIACSSKNECQIIQLNFDKEYSSFADTVLEDQKSFSDISSRTFLEHRALTFSSEAEICCSVEANNGLCHVILNGISKDIVSGKADGDANLGLCSYDKHKLLQRVFSEYNHHKSPFRQTSDNGLVRNSLRRQLGGHFKETKRPVDEIAQQNGDSNASKSANVHCERAVILPNGSVQICGPVRHAMHMCPSVDVEFEGSSYKDLAGVLKHGVTTLLYEKLSYNSPAIHTVQFHPVYLNEDNSNETSDNDFLSSKRKSLIGLFVVISTVSCGLVYTLLGGTKKITEYEYSGETIRVHLDDCQLFALSPSLLEVYTSQCTAHVINDCEKRDDQKMQTLPYLEEGPCLIGMQSFINLQDISVTGSHVTLLSKSVGSTELDDSWSVYTLKRPDPSNLYTVMVDRALSFGDLNTVALVQVLREAHMILRGQLYTRRWQGEGSELVRLIRSSSLHLAQFYEKSETLSHIAIPYYLMAGQSFDEIIKKMVNSSWSSSSQVVQKFKEALLWYCDRFCSDNVNVQNCNTSHSI